MITHVSFWAATAAMFFAIAPTQKVAAQGTYTPLGSNVPRPVRTREIDQEDVGLVRDEFARCTFAENRSNVDRLLAASDPGGIDFDQLGIPQRRFSAAFSMPDCLTEAQEITRSQLILGTNAVSFRFMMMEAAYLDRYPEPPAWLQGEIETPERLYISDEEDLGEAMALGSFADCVVAAAPVETDALLRTPSKSPAETAAVQPIIPHLGPCLADGQVLELQVENVRQFAAEGLWHLASAHQDTNAMEAAE